MGKWSDAARAIRAIMDRAGLLLTDEQALEVPELFPIWNSNSIAYAVGDRVQYESKLYSCIQAHTSQESWQPSLTPALWNLVSIEEWPEWVQPAGAHDAYAKDDRVLHNGKKWISIVDNNVWEPGVYGWNEITD